jgi:orotate phosphoribosyltransferase
LIDCIKKNTVFGKFERRSGGICEYYINSRQLLLQDETIAIIAQYVFSLAMQVKATVVGGETDSALPLIGAVLGMAAQTNYRLKGFFIRSEKKEYGYHKEIEGCITEIDKVLLIDDLIGKGNSALRCINLLSSINCQIAGFFSVVDRGEGAEMLLLKKKVTLFSIITVNDTFFDDTKWQ